MKTKKKAKDEKRIWSAKSHSIFERFAAELNEYTKNGQPPSGGDQDVRYALELQQQRLAQKNLHMEYDITPRGLLDGRNSISRSWSDARYVSKMEYQSCQIRRRFFREGKEIYDKKQNAIFYQIITNTHNVSAVGSEPYTCPNCGAISRVSELQNGCPYCGTFFEMSDLFPKVTNFYFLRDYGGTKEEINRSIAKTVIPAILIAVIAYFFVFYKAMPEDGYLILCVLQAIFGGVICGGIVGYMIWAFGMLGTLFRDAGRSIGKLASIGGSRRRFVSQMKRLSPEFSYEYFSNKVVSMLKMILFAEHAQELPVYAGGPVEKLFSNIAESSYTGAVGLKKFRVKGDCCYVTVDVFMDDIYDNGRRLTRREDIFRLELCRNISRPIDFYFSVKKIQCHGCGGSFDATKQRTCPYCGRQYDLQEDDWVVLSIRKR